MQNKVVHLAQIRPVPAKDYARTALLAKDTEEAVSTATGVHCPSIALPMLPLHLARPVLKPPDFVGANEACTNAGNEEDGYVFCASGWGCTEEEGTTTTTTTRSAQPERQVAFGQSSSFLLPEMELT